MTLQRRAWVRLNHFRTGVRRFSSCLCKWYFAFSFFTWHCNTVLNTLINSLDVKFYWFTPPGLHNIRPAGRMRPSGAFAIAENVATAALRKYNQLSSQNLYQTTTKWNRFCDPLQIYVVNWPFKLSDLCRPALHGWLIECWVVVDVWS